ncbi:pyridoxamine 5'-phosphate oxidase family protein [bacterium]|nr:pyridoxamine 5'-phosphate oxidase family protein [bacterium]
MNKEEPGFYNNKDLILDEIWALLSKGVTDRNEDFRLPVVGLNSKQGPDARIVVLRGAFQDRNILRFHTDIRSDKIDFIKNNNQIYFLFYNKERKIQVRATGAATIHYKNDLTKEVLERTAWHSGQHTRQVVLMLKEKLNLVPNEPIEDAVFQGLPMPKNIWDNERSFSEGSYSGQALSSVEDFKNL